MAIPEAQLERWCNPGADATAKATHTSIRYALETAGTSLVANHSIEIFLQGSYRNATNIYSDSDVDVVGLLRETYTRDAARLSAFERLVEQQAFDATPKATYPWSQFRADVLTSLRAYYGAAEVQDGDKAIKVLAGNGRLAADVVPAVIHKAYTYFGTTILTAGAENHIEGISFYDKAWRQVVNFPKQHIDNGQNKNGATRTGGNYKPSVRMFKNARRYLVDKQKVAAGVAPSYFIECLLYNVPDNLFGNDRQATMRGILQWLLDNPLPPMVCQNGVMPLFGTTPEQWTLANGQTLINALADMWNNWPI